VRQDGGVALTYPFVPDTAEIRKARGAFFTPEPVARYVTEWAVRSADDRVMEPSCGEASFLLAATVRLRSLGEHAGTHRNVTPRVDGVEIHEASAAEAVTQLRAAGAAPQITTADFFSLEPTGTYDAVIGNPPYVRYQDFAGESRTRSREAALRAGVSLTALASSWAAFTVHSALFLRRGGRLGLVLPAELLSVNYAAEVRRFLLERFAHVDLVLFNERVFPGVLEEVVLLLADGYRDGPAGHASIYQVNNAEDLASVSAGHVWTPDRPGDKWTLSMLSATALQAYSDLSGAEEFTTLEAWGDTTLGMVTGNNKYFALSPARARELGMRPNDMIKLSPPGSRHLRGLSLTGESLRELGDSGSATWLFRPGQKPSVAALGYIKAGEIAGVHEAYKCRVRKPWWRVPLVKPADLFLTYMNADTPRITTNRAGVHHLNSVHGVYLKAEYAELGRELLPLAALNSLTLLGAETVGRAYGGGMLKIEPREADRLPLPTPASVEHNAVQLRALRRTVGDLLRSGDLLGAVRLVDQVLLVDGHGVERATVDLLAQARATLAARRVSRGMNASDRT
jgi:adenine-specific DNA-methyltransferase